MTTTPVGVQQVLITAEALREQLDAGGDVVILEVRRDTTDQPGAGRIPGARAVALSSDLVGPGTFWAWSSNSARPVATGDQPG